jgi:hypothetical protein
MKIPMEKKNKTKTASPWLSYAGTKCSLAGPVFLSKSSVSPTRYDVVLFIYPTSSSISLLSTNSRSHTT